MIGLHMLAPHIRTDDMMTKAAGSLVGCFVSGRLQGMALECNKRYLLASLLWLACRQSVSS